MDARLVVFVAVVCSALLVHQVSCEALEDQLPDTTGLFFGKRSSHPNMNNLLFGRRSGYDSLGNKQLTFDEARRICLSVQAQCAKWGAAAAAAEGN